MTNTKNYSGSRKGVARFVKDQLTLLNPDCASIMIMRRDMSGEPYAITAIAASLADIERLVARSSSMPPLPTSEVPIPDGLSQPKEKRKRPKGSQDG